MKIGVSNYSFLRYFRQTGVSYQKMCEIAKSIGFDGIEFIALDHTIFSLTNDAMETAKHLRDHCERLGIEIIAYAVGANLLSDDMDAEMACLRGCVDVTAALGANVMRHDVCNAPRKLPRYTYREAIGEIAPYIRTLTEYAAERGIQTCTENHGRFFQDPERMEALIREVNHPNYGWLVDIGNFLGVDADILHGVTVASPYTIHVHAKDVLRKPAGDIRPEGFSMTRGGNYTRATILGHGVVPVAQCLRILSDSGYDGYVSLEFEGFEDNIQALEMGHAYLRRLIEKGA